MTEPGLQDVLYGPAGQLEAVPTLITLPPAPLIAAFFLGLALLLKWTQGRVQGAMRTAVRVGRWAAWGAFGAAMLFWGSFVFDQWAYPYLTSSFGDILHHTIFGPELRYRFTDCKAAILATPSATPDHLCHYQSVELCKLWWYDRRCVVLTVDDDMYAQLWFREILEDVVRSPCDHITANDVFAGSQFWCNFDYVRPRFIVQVVVRNIEGGRLPWLR